MLPLRGPTERYRRLWRRAGAFEHDAWRRTTRICLRLLEGPQSLKTLQAITPTHVLPPCYHREVLLSSNLELQRVRADLRVSTVKLPITPSPRRAKGSSQDYHTHARTHQEALRRDSCNHGREPETNERPALAAAEAGRTGRHRHPGVLPRHRGGGGVEPTWQ